MGQSRNCLHFDCVPLVKGVIQDSRSVDDLPLGILVLAVANKQVLGCERVGLHIDIGIRDVVNERGFTDIWEAGDDKSA